MEINVVVSNRDEKGESMSFGNNLANLARVTLDLSLLTPFIYKHTHTHTHIENYWMCGHPKCAYSAAIPISPNLDYQLQDINRSSSSTNLLAYWRKIIVSKSFAHETSGCKKNCVFSHRIKITFDHRVHSLVWCFNFMLINVSKLRWMFGSCTRCHILELFQTYVEWEEILVKHDLRNAVTSTQHKSQHSIIPTA